MLLPFVSFLLSCSLLNYSYPIIIDKLEDNTPNFKNCDTVRKHYVVKNLMKAVYLCFLALIGLPFFGLSFTGYFPNNPIKILAGLYCSNDCVGLYKVEKLPTSTRLHHLVTSVFLIASYTVDFQTNRVAQMLFYYTYFSACTFCVNAYLGLRFCYDYSDIKDYHHFSKHIYAASCLFNWIVQFYMIGSTVYDFAYCGLLLFIVYDDIVLLNWLWKQHEL